MRGYITEEELALLLSGQVSKDDVNVYGYQRTPEGAYTEVNGGWTIQAADGTYLALENKALVNTSAAFTWTYSNGRFSTTVETGSTGNNWWGGCFGNWWGSGSSTTYTATITVNAEGTEMQSVAYSTDGGNTCRHFLHFLQ